MIGCDFLKLNDVHKCTIIEMIYVFVSCAFIGWFMEVSGIYILLDKVVKRGILYGPFCSIYGFAGILLYYIYFNIPKLKSNIFVLFITSSFMLGALELISGLFFKHVFNIEMWNYNGQFLEIYDYTTLPMVLLWGFLGSIYILFLQSKLLKCINLIPENDRYSIAYIIVILYLLDFEFSVYNIIRNPQILTNLLHI